MRIRTCVAGVVFLTASLLPLSATAQAADPWIGTWILNAAKSKYSPGPAPKSTTVTIAAMGGGFHQTVESVPATGPIQKWEVMATFDGKDCAVKGNNPNADAYSYKKIDARTYEAVAKRGGKAMLTSRITISADGKTRTNTQTGTGADGKPVNNTTVYERK
jgi:hypothetical protein